MTNTPTRIGILGSGSVSHLYLPNLVESSLLEIAGIADLDTELAQQVADQYGIGPVVTPDELIADPSIEIIVNLTSIKAHVATTTAALEAGKHVYSEKPLATTVQDAQQLADLATARGLFLTGAPDTLLGSGFQAPLAALAGGAIGKPLAITATMIRSEIPDASFYSAGSFPVFDMAPYYVAGLLLALGPVRAVSGTARLWKPGERPDDLTAGAPIHVAGTLELESGATASLTIGWGTERAAETTVLDVFGTTGVLGFPDPNNFGDPAFQLDYDENYRERAWREVPGSRQSHALRHNLRGLGIAEMAVAIRNGRKPRLDADLAVHVVDVIASLVAAAESGSRTALSTTFAPRDLLGDDERSLYLS